MSNDQAALSVGGVAWPDMFANLQTAYSELTQAQLDLEQRAAELAETRDQFNQALETLTEGLFVADQTGVVTQVNRAALRLLGRSVEMVVGRPLAEFWVGANVPTTPWLILSQSENGRFGPLETELHSFEGRLLPVSLSCAVMRDINGKITGVLAVARDIRETRLLQQQLVQSGKLAAVGELATGVAHELNQPLQIIRGYAQMIDEEYQPGTLVDDFLRKDLRKIIDGTGRMMRIIDHLRAFARAESAGVEKIDLNNVVEQALLFVAQQLRNNNIEVVTVPNQQLPKVRADPHELEQVLLNLFSNARDALPEGGTITITSTIEQHLVLLSVQDTGPGIPEHIRERIFDPFFTTKEVGKGTGLGLSISYNILKKYGGSISVESSSDQGTTFFLRLPIADGTSEDTGAEDDTLNTPNHGG